MKSHCSFFIIISFLLSSCSKSLYYAYETKGSYNTFEITKNNEVIYRASSNHYKTNDITSIDYVYVYSPNSTTSLGFALGKNSLLKDLRNIELKKETICGTSSKNLTDFLNDFVLYTHTDKKDSLELVMTSKMKTKLLEEKCFKERGLTWFPPYVKRVKKINYNKFNLPVKKKYLKTMEDKDR